MSKYDVVRAWKDPAYRATLSIADLPANPAGTIDATEEEVKAASFGGFPDTTVDTCTLYTFRGWAACCP